MKINLTDNGVNYKVITRKLKTNSNYNIGIHFYEEDDLISGTSMKNTSTKQDFINWGLEKIKQRK